MKKIGIVIGIMIVLVTTVGSLAYFVSKETKVNEFEIGSIEARIDETFDGVHANDLSTNKKIDKFVAITNTGKSNEVIRVVMNPQWESKSADGKDIPVSASNQIELNLRNGFEDDWIESSDGYYYYKKVLKPGETTSNLLESVSIKKDITEDEKHEFKYRDLSVNVSVEAMQVNTQAIEDNWNKNNTMDTNVVTYLDKLINEK